MKRLGPPPSISGRAQREARLLWRFGWTLREIGALNGRTTHAAFTALRREGVQGERRSGRRRMSNAERSTRLRLIRRRYIMRQCGLTSWPWGES